MENRLKIRYSVFISNTKHLLGAPTIHCTNLLTSVILILTDKMVIKLRNLFTRPTREEQKEFKDVIRDKVFSKKDLEQGDGKEN